MPTTLPVRLAWSSLLAASCLLLAGSLPLRAVAADASGAAVRAAWQQLEQWLGQDANSDAWRRHLLAEQLEAQLARGPSADPQEVARILQRFAGGAAGLDRTPFVSVRTALSDWYVELLSAEASELPALVRAAKGSFTVPPRGSWEAKRRDVQRRARALDAYLAEGGEAYRSAWHTYLNWATLEEQLAADTPNLAQLNQVLQQLYGYQAGLELPVFSQLRTSLHGFMNASVVRNSMNIEQQYDEQLEQLAAAIEAELADPTQNQEPIMGRTLGWLYSANQAPHVQRLVRRQYARPNFFASVSSDFATGGVNEPVDDTMEVRDCILGTSLYGTARTLGNVHLALLPNPHRVELALELNGTAFSNNIGTQRGVTIYSTGRTYLNAQKRLTFDADGLNSYPATATASTDSDIHDIQHRLRLVERIAWKQARRQQPQAERVASQRAAGRLQAQFNARTSEMLADPRRQYLDKIRAPLLRRGQFPELMHLASTASGIQLRMLQASAFQIGAPEPPPELPGRYDLAVRLHESFVGNMSEALLGGFLLTDEKLVRALQEAERDVPDELKLEPNKDPWSITFADNQPVRVEFRDQTVRIVIRGKRFTRGDQPVRDEMEISAVYALTRTPTGAKLTRQGEVQAEYTKQGFENALKIAVKTLMRKKFSALFQEEFVGEGIPLEGRLGAGRILRLARLNVEQGWLAGGWMADAPTPSGAPAGLAQAHSARATSQSAALQAPKEDR